MATKPPTAEEVLGLWTTYRQRGSTEDYEAFMNAYLHWHQSQGPVTREWFMDRFGTNDVKTRTGLRIKHSGSSVPWIYLTDIEGCTQFNQPLTNPTRERTEALVEMLGGKV